MLDISKLLEAEKIEEAIELKSQTVVMLQKVIKYDRFGFARVLLQRAKERKAELVALKKHKEQAKGGEARAAINMAKKRTFKDAEDECDCDMGFDLFD